MGTHSGPTPPVCVCEGGHVGTSSSTATPRGVTWRGGGDLAAPRLLLPTPGATDGRPHLSHELLGEGELSQH